MVDGVCLSSKEKGMGVLKLLLTAVSPLLNNLRWLWGCTPFQCLSSRIVIQSLRSVIPLFPFHQC